MDRTNHSCEVARRLRLLRLELFGVHGLPELARKIGIPTRIWLRYEAGERPPTRILTRLAEVTPVDLTWLLSGVGPQYRLPLQRYPRLHSGDLGGRANSLP
jgi:hypothetical protein